MYFQILKKALYLILLLTKSLNTSSSSGFESRCLVMNIKLDGNRSLPLLSSLNIPNIVPEGGPAPKATPPVKAGDQAPLSFEDCLGFKPLILDTGAALLTLASIMEGGAGSGGAATPCLPCCCPIT